MRLHELEIGKDLRDPELGSHKDFYSMGIGLKRVLQKQGWKVIGKGVEGAVAEHPNKDFVVKLFSSNSAYIKFVDYVKTHSDNPHLPKFVKYTRSIPGTDFMYVCIEKLQKVSETTLINSYFSEMTMLYLVQIKSKIWTTGNDLQSPVNDFFREHSIDVNNIDKDQAWKYIKKPDDQWIQLVEDLVRIAVKLRYDRLDLKDENFMLRGSTLIIIDPFYG